MNEIIYTNNYALIVSDEKPLYKDYYINEFMIAVRTGIDDSEYVEDYIKKIIAHRPLTDVPILEGVSLLPEFSWNQQDDVEKKSRDFVKQIGGSQEQRLAFIDGYLEAKETYKYTEKDLIEAIEIAQTPTDYDKYPLINEIIQSLQQPKRPKYFNPRMKEIPCPDNKLGCLVAHFKKVTITNSQGQTELVGEYIYE